MKIKKLDKISLNLVRGGNADIRQENSLEGGPYQRQPEKF